METRTVLTSPNRQRGFGKPFADGAFFAIGAAAAGLIALFGALAAAAPPSGPTDPRHEASQTASQPGGTGVPASQPAANARQREAARRLLAQIDDEAEPLRRAVAFMDDCSQRLTGDYNPGPGTQEIQQRVMRAIDQAIHEAKKGQSGGGQGGSGRSTGEARKAGRRAVARTGRGASRADASSSDGAAGRGADSQSADGKPLADRPELRRGWGFLPARDREAIVQGAGEEFPAQYRERIEQYYRAIAEQAESRP
jgi:hypothetical protein